MIIGIFSVWLVCSIDLKTPTHIKQNQNYSNVCLKAIISTHSFPQCGQHGTVLLDWDSRIEKEIGLMVIYDHFINKNENNEIILKELRKTAVINRL